MMLKTLTVLCLLAACTALPLEDVQNGEDIGPLGPPQQTSNVEGDASDLETDSTYWRLGGLGWGRWGYPHHRRSYSYYPTYRRYHYTYPVYPSYPTYWGTYW